MANHGSNLNDNVSIHALKCFCTVAEIENITKAAELLYISQPALSRKLSQLEAQVGVPLFKRKKNGVELTADGRVVYEHCRNIIENCESLFSGCQHTEENLSGSLKFGFQRPSIEFALKLSREFNSAYPSVSLNMEKIGKYNVIEELLNLFDAALLFTRELKNYANLIDSIPVGSCKMAVMVPKTHPLATRDVIDLAELKDEKFVVLDRTIAPVKIEELYKNCNQCGFFPKVASIEKEHLNIISKVLLHNAVSIMPVPKTNSDDLVVDMGVQYVDLCGFDTEYPICLAWARSNKNPMLPVFIDYARRVFAGAAKDVP